MTFRLGQSACSILWLRGYFGKSVRLLFDKAGIQHIQLESLPGGFMELAEEQALCSWGPRTGRTEIRAVGPLVGQQRGGQPPEDAWIRPCLQPWCVSEFLLGRASKFLLVSLQFDFSFVPLLPKASSLPHLPQQQQHASVRVLWSRSS